MLLLKSIPLALLLTTPWFQVNHKPVVKAQKPAVKEVDSATEEINRFKQMSSDKRIRYGAYDIIGIEKALRFGLSPTIAIILGTMTGSFGGVIRDILANKLPALFHKEIYATACIAGGTVYFLIDDFVNHNLVVFITIMVVISVRLLSVKYHWELPKF